MAQQLGLLLHAQNCLNEEKEKKLRHEVSSFSLPQKVMGFVTKTHHSFIFEG
jgi:hypothetical protein